MFCPRCGRQMDDRAAVCLSCGKSLTGTAQPKEEGHVSAGWWWLGFFVPIAGLFLWIFCQENEPKKARKAGWGALIGTILSIVFMVLFYALFMILPFLLMRAF